jgi:hypothetical protein
MSHPDTCWRVAVIHRCCVRYGKTHAWALDQLLKLRVMSAEGNCISGRSIPNLADIWFRKNGGGTSHIDQQRAAYHHV